MDKVYVVTMYDGETFKGVVGVYGARGLAVQALEQLKELKDTHIFIIVPYTLGKMEISNG